MRRLLFLLLMFPVFAFTQEVYSDNEKDAIKAANDFVVQLDNKQYLENWQATGVLFRNAIKSEDWEATISGVREPLGGLIEREVKSVEYLTEIPGAPDGEYVIIQFTSSFENKKTTTETVTPTKEEDGIWRVVGYYIK